MADTPEQARERVERARRDVAAHSRNHPLDEWQRWLVASLARDAIKRERVLYGQTPRERLPVGQPRRVSRWRPRPSASTTSPEPST